MQTNYMRKKLFVIAWFLLFSTTIFAQPRNNNVRPCSKKELIGEWRTVLIVANPILISTSDDPWLKHPYQYFKFFDNNKMKHLTSTKPITEEEKKIYLPYMDFSDYEIDEKGILKLSSPGWARLMYFPCSYVTADTDLGNGRKLRKGNIVLYSYGKEGDIIASYILEKEIGR